LSGLPWDQKQRLRCVSSENTARKCAGPGLQNTPVDIFLSRPLAVPLLGRLPYYSWDHTLVQEGDLEITQLTVRRIPLMLWQTGQNQFLILLIWSCLFPTTLGWLKHHELYRKITCSRWLMKQILSYRWAPTDPCRKQGSASKLRFPFPRALSLKQRLVWKALGKGKI
jgi:hypothetical protein